ncbi:Putative amino-acid ABC transporter-binding protein YhdW [Seminavis robusta]|uniref:Amino-acid ABC transporter-binding protein YhdW n=1 Tax=Seminavis robusta TaxID=568900 RepID=A0A9N8I094_9STRA|nr:Putative amino-acid ABC transporter-binding protein YhdW [Seminavis robusta]|eukprot:Sro2576_g331740.1 Putative amino-acid ABC transporter-binding protein YhdW (837) ;mRNA; f:5689-8338
MSSSKDDHCNSKQTMSNELSGTDAATTPGPPSSKAGSARRNKSKTSSTGSAIPPEVLEKIVQCHVSHYSNKRGDSMEEQQHDLVSSQHDEKHHYRARPSVERNAAEHIMLPGAVRVMGLEGHESEELREAPLNESPQEENTASAASSQITLGSSSSSSDSDEAEVDNTHHDPEEGNTHNDPEPAWVAEANRLLALHGDNYEDDDVSHMSINSHGTEITAVRVDESKVEEEIRNRIIDEAVEAVVVVEDKDHNNTTRWALVGLCGVLIVAVVVAVAVVLASNQTNDAVTAVSEEEVKDTRPTMEQVRERGYVRCNTWGTWALSFPNPETGKHEGLNVDYCRAIAVAVFGDPDRYEIVSDQVEDSFVMLANGQVDVVTSAFTHNMARDVFEATSQTPLTFSTPYFYSGVAFAGIPTFVDCADNLDSLFGVCRDLTICVLIGTTHIGHLEELLPGADVVLVESLDDEVASLKEGICNVIASEPVFLPEVAFRELGYDGPFQIGQHVFSREPLAVQTRSDDHEWSNFVNLIVQVFFLAEAHNITKSNADQLKPLFGDDKDVADKMVAVVQEFGNYADLYKAHVEQVLPRAGLNQLYNPQTDHSGLMYSHPFGKSALQEEGPGIQPDGSIDKILTRGHLLCGVESRPGFAFVGEDGQWRGFDVEFCRAIAAALFEHVTKHDVVFVEPGAEQTMYSLLAEEQVDVFAGAPVTLQADYMEPTTGRRFAFSPPYYYDNENDAKAFAMMTLEHLDGQLSDFVYWIVMALIYAEEHGIEPRTSFEMPVARLFGDGLKQMLRDCVLAVGSYAHIYNRTLESTIPRSGANQLNHDSAPGPQQYAIPYR